MPFGRKRKLFSNAKAESAKILRQKETPDERQERLKKTAEYKQKRRQNETLDERQDRLHKMAATIQEKRLHETPDERQERLKRMAETAQEKRQNETPDERSCRLNKMAIAAKLKRDNVTQPPLKKTHFLAMKSFNEDDILEQNGGPLNDTCQFCNSLNFKAERPTDKLFTSCCHKGKVILPEFSKCPQIIQDLLSNKHEHSANFMEHIRSYNSALAFASMGAQVDQIAGHGPYSFKIHGQVYHRTSALYPKEGEVPKFAQIYILDTQQALNQRMGMIENSGCLPQLMQELSDLISKINPFASACKMMREVELEETEKAAAEGREVSEITMWIHKDKNNDQRRYNAPNVNEVAVVFRNVDGEPPFERDICIHQRDGHLVNISFLSPNCDPMTYPVLFPKGDKGWEQKMSKVGHSNMQLKNVTHLQFYSFHLAIRSNFNPILYGGKLFQQYVVDAYTKVEANRLNWVKTNQPQLRADLYSGLMDCIHNKAENEGLKAGKLVILPSSFQGSPRAMQQNFQDAMSIVRHFGRPDLFITFTCNPKWKEITENLQPGQKSHDRPDLVARVFHFKMKELLDDLLKKQIFGVVVGHVWVVEYQKRGLPHIHILLILRKEDKIHSAETIDKIVSAEIPDAAVNPRLIEIVKKMMVHGPCGTQNPRSPCMEAGSCSKSFPKQFAETTLECVDGYPIYRRSENGTKIQVGRHSVDNTWIVPYNPFLSLKYNAHINVEICSSIKSVKYLFKYVYKGHDCANIKLGKEGEQTLDWDEPNMLMDSRYVSAPEAMWRLREYPMHSQSHSVSRLAVHLPSQQWVCFPAKQPLSSVVESVKDTTLTAWFKLNQDEMDANQYLYHEIPYHYVFHKKESKWRVRQRGADSKISRMYNVSPADSERYYLRLLLLHVKGARSFEDVRTVDGVLCSSFQEAARQRKLLCDDTEWENCLNEAEGFQMPKNLRQLFGIICALCQPSDPLKLWDRHKGALTEDFLRYHTVEVSEQLALSDIQETLCMHGKTCESVGLPVASYQPNNEEEFNMQEEAKIGGELYSMLNTRQRHAFDIVLHAIQTPDFPKRYFFLDGPGGSGKSFTYNALIRTLRGNGTQLKSVALTGIAANLLIDGRTVHSTFGVPLCLSDTSTSSITATSYKGRCLIETKLIIWDECTMASSHILRLVDQLLRDLMDTPSTPFGGKVMLLGGHFSQILPVLKRGNRVDTIGSCLKSSPLWTNFTHLQLQQNMRIDPNEEQFSNWLLQLGNGELLNSDNLGDDVVEIPSECIVQGDIIDDVFGEKIAVNDAHHYSQRAILCPLNKDAINLNEEVLERLEGPLKTYFSFDKVVVREDDAETNYPIEFLNSLTPSGLPTHKLNLKVGAVVMLLRNINQRKGLCNGTRLIVRSLMDHVIDAEILNGTNKGDRVFIPRIGLDTTEDTELPFDMHRRQFPIRLAYVITINKAQGQTLDMVGIFLPSQVFTHGQLYVAFSRAKAKSKVKVKVFNNGRQGSLIQGSEKVFTLNCVYKEVLDKIIPGCDYNTIIQELIFEDGMDAVMATVDIDQLLFANEASNSEEEYGMTEYDIDQLQLEVHQSNWETCLQICSNL